MATNLVAIFRNKLVGIDSLLPILMELKTRHSAVRIILVFMNKNDQTLVKKNYHIWGALRQIQAEIIILRYRNTKLSAARAWLKLIVKLALDNNIILKSHDVLPKQAFTMACLRCISRVKEIKTFLLTVTHEGYENHYEQARLFSERQGKSFALPYFSGRYGYFLSTLAEKQFLDFFKIKAPSNKIIHVGYVRRLPTWQKYMETAWLNDAQLPASPYFVYILATLGKASNLMDEPEMRELLAESLKIFKQYNQRILTVFRPHSVTDVKALEQLLKEIGYANYVIHYGHPMILTARAKFVFGNYFSNTMFDAYYQGRPILEYSQIDPEMKAKIHHGSFGGRCADMLIHRDPTALRKIADQWINQDIAVKRDRDFIESNFSQTSERFYQFWESVL